MLNIFPTLLIRISPVLLLVGCASMLPAIHEMPAVNRIFIHDNPAVGDYAVHGEIGNSMQMTKRYEVAAIEGDRITIRWRMYYGKSGYEDMAPKEWYYLLVDRQGHVLKAWARTDDKQHFNTPVAVEGQVGSLENYKSTKRFVPETIRVGKKHIPADSVHFYTARVDAVFVTGSSMIVEYQSSKVPFRMLERRLKTSIDTGVALKTFEAIVAAGDAYQSNNPLSMQGKVAPADGEYNNIFSLLEYGFASR